MESKFFQDLRKLRVGGDGCGDGEVKLIQTCQKWTVDRTGHQPIYIYDGTKQTSQFKFQPMRTQYRVRQRLLTSQRWGEWAQCKHLNIHGCGHFQRH